MSRECSTGRIIKSIVGVPKLHCFIVARRCLPANSALLASIWQGQSCRAFFHVPKPRNHVMFTWLALPTFLLFFFSPILRLDISSGSIAHSALHYYQVMPWCNIGSNVYCVRLLVCLLTCSSLERKGRALGHLFEMRTVFTPRFFHT